MGSLPQPGTACSSRRPAPENLPGIGRASAARARGRSSSVWALWAGGGTVTARGKSERSGKLVALPLSLQSVGRGRDFGPLFVCLGHSDMSDPMDCSPPGSSVHGILQARTLEWIAIPFSRGSSRPRD